MIGNIQEFAGYILRKLGAPVIDIHLADEQIEEAIGEAITMFNEYHRDGSERHYYVYKITQDDVVNDYIPFPKELGIDDVVDILGLDAIGGIGQWHTPSWQSAASMTSVKHGFSTIRLSDFVNMQMRLQDINNVLGKPMNFTFKKYARKLEPHFEIKADMELAFQCYKNVDPRVEGYEDAWEDKWLKDYATAKVKERWANVLVLMSNVKLPGGIELDGRSMLEQATEEIERLEAELKTGHQEPINFFIG